MFSLFPNLPYELRCEIWRYHVPGPRVVKSAHYLVPDKVYPRSAPPVLLHVCRESRNFLLSPAAGFSMLLATASYPAAICANVRTDAIQIPLWAITHDVIKVAELQTIVHLEFGRVRNEESADVLRLLMKLPNLETLSVVTPRAPGTDFLQHPRPVMSSKRHSPEWHETMRHQMDVADIIFLLTDLIFDMNRPEYDTWKKPLINFIFTAHDGSRFAHEGEFNPLWIRGIYNIDTRNDFAKSSMVRLLEKSRQNRPSG